MTTMDISSDLGHRPVARQMRHAILSYMQSADFQPALTLSPDQSSSHFFTRQAPPVNMFTNDSPDELKPKILFLQNNSQNLKFLINKKGWET